MVRSPHKLTLLTLAVLVLGAGVGYAIAGPGLPWSASENDDDEQVACTLEAKLCPDGSSVGRVPPSCEFAPCPGVPQDNGPDGEPGDAEDGKTVTVGFGGSATANDVTVTPLELIEDSRCPTDAECVQAGTVHIRVQMESGLGSATEVFTLGKPRTTEAEIVTLVAVEPEMNAYQRFELPDYRFTFRIEKRTTE